MNFQTVSTAEKLVSSPAVLIGPNRYGNYTEGPSLPGGYVTVDGQQVPGPLLRIALNYVNDALQRMADTIKAGGEADSTAIILTAKHGQSPLNNNELQRIDDGPIIAGVNAAWAAHHPSNTTLVVEAADDDGLVWWLSDRSQVAADFVKHYLWTHTAPAVNYAGRTITVQHSDLREIFAGQQSAQFFGVSNSDPHHPEVFGIAQVGTIYTTGTKIAEHGGDNPGDRDVPLVVYAPGTVQPGRSSKMVETSTPTTMRPAAVMCDPVHGCLLQASLEAPARGRGASQSGHPGGYDRVGQGCTRSVDRARLRTVSAGVLRGASKRVIGIDRRHSSTHRADP